MKHRARKRWGQHFLADTNLLRKLVEIIRPQPADSFLEIGPGEGALTEFLAPKIRELVGVEIDSGLSRTLAANENLRNCTFINGDFLKLDLATLPFSGHSIRVVGNIPYNITAPIIFKLLAGSSRWGDIHLMVQKEVADRLTASPGSRDYGRLSVMVQLSMEVRQVLLVPPEVFVPKPKVRSAFISLQSHNLYQIDDRIRNIFTEIVRVAFSQRRKMLRNSLRDFQFEKAGEIDLRRRPEALSVGEFLELARRSIQV